MLSVACLQKRLLTYTTLQLPRRCVLMCQTLQLDRASVFQAHSHMPNS